MEILCDWTARSGKEEEQVNQQRRMVKTCIEFVIRESLVSMNDRHTEVSFLTYLLLVLVKSIIARSFSIFRFQFLIFNFMICLVLLLCEVMQNTILGRSFGVYISRSLYAHVWFRPFLVYLFQVGSLVIKNLALALNQCC